MTIWSHWPILILPLIILIKKYHINKLWPYVSVYQFYIYKKVFILLPWPSSLVKGFPFKISKYNKSTW